MSSVHQIEVPYGYCHCGCGQRTSVHRVNVSTRGIVKGEPARYLANHYQRNSDKEFPRFPDEATADGMCAIEGCTNPQLRYGVCSLHYQRWKRTKSFDLVTITEEERFWSKVDKTSATGCWNWTATRNAQGYGAIRHNRKMVAAHRLVWEMTNGPIPDGLDVCHHCDNPSCVNPSHLFLGTHGDNMLDMAIKERRIFKLTQRDVKEIRRLRSEGRLLSDIAELFGISSSSVSGIALGRTWKHVV